MASRRGELPRPGPQRERIGTVDVATVHKETRAGDPIAYAASRALKTREQRAIALYEGFGDRIEQYGETLFYCPSQDGSRSYRVDYGGDVERCSCDDFRYRTGPSGGTCVHLYTMAIAGAKKRAQRRRNFIAALMADDGEQEE
jgi:hypothetical protein